MNSWCYPPLLTHIKRRIHPCDIPHVGVRGDNMLVFSRYHLPISLGRHSLILSSDGLFLTSNGLGLLEKGIPYITTCHGGRICRTLIINSNFFKRRILLPWEGTPRLVISSSSLIAEFLRVFILITLIQDLGESTHKVDSRGTTIDFQEKEDFLGII